MCTRSGDSVTAVFVAVDENVAQVIVQAELQQRVAGRGNGPAVFVMVIYQKAMSLSAVPKFAVMVCTASGAILNPVHIAVVMHHFMK